MATLKDMTLSKTRDTTTDWTDWTDAVEQEAAGCGLLVPLQNGVAGLPLAMPGINANASTWRLLAKTIKKSCTGKAGGHLKTVANIHNMQPHELWTELLVNGAMGVPDFTGQTLEAAQVMGEDASWASGANKKHDITSYLIDKEAALLRLPQKYPPQMVGGAPSVAHHILEALPTWFPAEFGETGSLKGDG